MKYYFQISYRSRDISDLPGFLCSTFCLFTYRGFFFGRHQDDVQTATSNADHPAKLAQAIQAIS